MTEPDDRPISDREFQAMWDRFERRVHDTGWRRPRRCADIVAEFRSRVAQADPGGVTTTTCGETW